MQVLKKARKIKMMYKNPHACCKSIELMYDGRALYVFCDKCMRLIYFKIDHESLKKQKVK